jgi:hypothetical protein
MVGRAGKGAPHVSDFATAVAQQVAQAWILERALHDDGPWTIRLPHSISFAERIIDEENGRVLFTTVLWVDPEDAGEAVLELLCGEETVSVRTADLPAGDSIVEWEFSLAQTTTV